MWGTTVYRCVGLLIRVKRTTARILCLAENGRSLPDVTDSLTRGLTAKANELCLWRLRACKVVVPRTLNVKRPSKWPNFNSKRAREALLDRYAVFWYGRHFSCDWILTRRSLPGEQKAEQTIFLLIRSSRRTVFLISPYPTFLVNFAVLVRNTPPQFSPERAKEERAFFNWREKRVPSWALKIAIRLSSFPYVDISGVYCFSQPSSPRFANVQKLIMLIWPIIGIFGNAINPLPRRRDMSNNSSNCLLRVNEATHTPNRSPSSINKRGTPQEYLFTFFPKWSNTYCTHLVSRRRLSRQQGSRSFYVSGRS